MEDPKTMEETMDNTLTEPAPIPVWWGDFEIPEGQAGSWQIGPLALSVQRQPMEWRVAYERAGGALDSTVAVACPVAPEAVVEKGKVLRIVSRHAQNLLHVTPVLADRPLVARPETAFRLLPGEEIALYVSIPLWVRVEIGTQSENGRQQILNVATWRPPDTWFGPSTGDGELGYAIRINARLNRENLPVLGHRAITQVVVRNRAQDNLSLVRMNLPVPTLSLYYDADSYLWTQTVMMERDREGKLVQVDIGSGPPKEIRDPQLVSGPREEVQRNILVRALSRLLL